MNNKCDLKRCNDKKECVEGDCGCGCKPKTCCLPKDACEKKQCKDACFTECNSSEKCPCDLLKECTGIKKCSKGDCTGYCIALPHGITKDDVKISQKGNVVTVEYHKEINDGNNYSKRTGSYSFTLAGQEGICKTHIEGCKLFLKVDKSSKKDGPILLE